MAVIICKLAPFSFIFLVVIANEFKTSSFNVGVLLLILFSILVGLVDLFVTELIKSTFHIANTLSSVMYVYID